MIGTGVFTSIGFQVIDISSGFAILLLWIVGGLMAFLGSMSYSMLGIAFPRSGGEYNYLSKMYHPVAGFLSGWISLVVGFAAPIAAAAYAFGIYLSNFSALYLKGYTEPFNPKIAAIVIIILLTLMNVFNKKIGANFQKIFTIIKIFIVIVIIGIGLFSAGTTNVDYSMNSLAIKDIISPEFCIAMFFVTYSYSGWNAISYISGEISNESRTLPRILISGSLFVCVLYVLLNYVFLKIIPMNEMAGVLDIGYLFANKIVGVQLGGIMSILICLLLVSSINSMIIVGPRVSMVMGEDYKKLNFLALKNKMEVPFVSILVQIILAIIYILTSSFESLIVYVGFVITLFTFFTVLGLFFYKKEDDIMINKFKSFGYPILPLLFLAFNLWILIYGLLYKPLESLVGLGMCFLGFIIYLVISKEYK